MLVRPGFHLDPAIFEVEIMKFIAGTFPRFKGGVMPMNCRNCLENGQLPDEAPNLFLRKPPRAVLEEPFPQIDPIH